MADYDLTRLGPNEFEQLVQALAARVLGSSVRVYGLGPDGGRDAATRERVVVPGAAEPWTGNSIIQVKFRHRPEGAAANASWLARQVRLEMQQWEKRVAAGAPPPSNLLIATNIVLAPAPGAGIDAVERVVDDMAGRVPLQHFLVWHYDQLCRLLDDAADIRSAYAGLITPGDVLEDLARAHRSARARISVNMAPALTPSFVPRDEEGNRLVAALVDRDDAGVVVGLVSPTALHGTGGYGKTSLAAWACRQPAVAEAFPDGVLWVELGRGLTDERVIALLADLIVLLTGAPAPAFSTVPAAAAALGAATTGKRVLLAIDDVWSRQDLEPFLVGDPICRRLVTTRRPAVLPAGGESIDIGLMSPAQAMALLTAGLSPSDRHALMRLYERSGRWPLALALLNGVVRSMVDRFAVPVGEVVDGLVGRLDSLGVAALDVLAVDARSISAALEVSLDELADAVDTVHVDRLVSLAAFPEGHLLSYELLALLWRTDALDARQSCELLADRSLLGSTTAAGVTAHDEIRDHLRRTRWPQTEGAHEEILDRLRVECPQGWFDLPDTVPEAADTLAFHLLNARREEELRESLRDLRYHAARLRTAGPAGLAGDVSLCENACGRDPVLGTLARCIALEGHLTLGLRRAKDVAATWHSRLVGHPVLLDGLGGLGILTGSFTASRPFPDVPDRRLRTVLHGHGDRITCLSWRSDGERLLTGSDDGTARIWDMRANRGLTVLRHENQAAVSAVVWSPDSLYVAVGCDGFVVLFDAVDGDMVSSAAVPGPVHCLGFSPDNGLLLVSCGTRMVTLLGEELGIGCEAELPSRSFRWMTQDHVLAGGLNGQIARLRVTPTSIEVVSEGPTALLSIRDVQIRSDGDLAAVVGAGSRVLLVEPLGPSVTAASAEKQSGLNSCAWTDDGRTLAVGTADGFVDIWGDPAASVVHAVPDGELREAWEQQLGVLTVVDYNGVFVNDVEWRPHGDQLAVAANSPVVRVWGGLNADPAPRRMAVFDVAWQPGGVLVAAGTADGEVVVASSTSEARWSRAAHDREVRSVAWSSDGRWLIAHSEDRRLSLWEVDHGCHQVGLVEHDGEWAGPVVWSPDGQRVVAATGSVLQEFERNERSLILTRSIDLGAHVSSLAVSSTGAYLVGTSGDELLVVHATKFTVERREATDGGIIAIAPLLDGTFITACHDGQLARWSRDATAHDRNPRLPIDSVWDFAIATDSTTFAAAGSNGAAWFGDLRFLADASMIRMDSGITSCAFPTKGSEVTFSGAAGLYFCQPVIGAP